MIMDVPLIYLKGKKAYTRRLGTLKPMGSAIKIAKRLKERLGTELVHIVDLDALKGKKTNYDVYDHLTFTMYVQVEVQPDPKLIKPLLDIDARVVIELPAKKLDLKQFEDKKRLIVGKITPRFRGSLDEVYDVYLDGESPSKLQELLRKKKRVFVNRDQNKKSDKVFGRIGPPEL
ncbi:hypothetical protein GF412_00725 [Candidatus Micrarchaeota archaeon]|nr:hypothetical protein [Candidatus Micrarchaeota archaeon]MBD3417497.1 hypothetical protein [Candidatus Micrarchaeota archaeon]